MANNRNKLAFCKIAYKLIFIDINVENNFLQSDNFSEMVIATSEKITELLAKIEQIIRIFDRKLDRLLQSTIVCCKSF